MDNAILALATGSGVFVLEHQENEWRTISRGLEGIETNCVDVRESTLLVGSTQGLYLSEDAGASWHKSEAGITKPHARWLMIYPDMPHRAFLGTEPASIFVSKDGGRSWRECPEVGKLRDQFGWYLPYSPEAGCIRGFAAAGEHVYAAVEQGGVLVSNDSGETWTMAKGSTGEPKDQPAGNVHQDVHSIEIHGSWLFAATGGGLYRSHDGGAHWEHLYSCYCRALAIDPVNHHHVILGPADGVSHNGRIEVTVDNGYTWLPARRAFGAPWTSHMVERFLRIGDNVIAILNSGRMLSAAPDGLDWIPFLEQYSNVNAAACHS